jgi:hypothetical protein
LTTRSIATRLIELGRRVQDSLDQGSQGSHALAVEKSRAPLAEPGPELPIVARLVVEIRSDGTRTVARGAIEDHATNQRVAVEAHGTTPAELAASLAKSMFSMPALAAAAVRAVLGSALPGGRNEP